MLILILFVGVTVLAAVAGKVGVPGLNDWRACMRAGLAAALLLAGIDHIVTTHRYLPMMPDFVPYPREVVIFTGLCEIAAAIGLFIPRLRWLTGVMLAIYFVAVFPANIKSAVEGIPIEGFPSDNIYYWIRLLFQPPIIWWSLYCTGVIDWPFARKSYAAAGPRPIA